MSTNATLWTTWIIVTLLIGSFFAYKVFVDTDKEALLIGAASHGHFQIELACSSCHSKPFADERTLQRACEGCHQQELDVARDSHPKSKFTDPRNVDLLAGIDARFCVACHTEHQAERTLAMGVTLPEDLCFNCHQEIAEERPSHTGLAYDSCATSGCHNFHDNRALYEDFLIANAGGEWLRVAASLATPTHSARIEVPEQASAPLFTDQQAAHPEMVEHWAASSHAAAEVGCAGCHGGLADSAAAPASTWIERPGIEQCQACHQSEAEGFLAGKHGMRLASGLTAMTPAQSSLVFTSESLSVHQGCSTCHSAHAFDTRRAATESCLGCHADQHSLAFTDSPHGGLAQRELLGEISAGQVVTCATCHMPRLPDEADATLVRVQHNQNDVLRPNEKMIRPVCMQCHSLSFSIDALADPALIQNNFSGQPARHVPSIDWATERAQ